MRLLITGDSHTGALYRGLKEMRASGSVSAEIVVRPLGGGHLLPTPFFRDAGDHAAVVDPNYRQAFERLPPEGAGYDAIGLSMPLWPMRLLHQMNWGKWSLSEEIEGRRPVSHAVFREMVMADQKYVLLLAELLQRCGLEVFAVSAPTLFRDHNSLKRLPPAHGLKIFQTYRAIICAELDARKVDIIDIPPQCLDDEGFMKQDYRHEDPKDEHHGNAAFGRLMMQAVEDWAAAKG